LYLWKWINGMPQGSREIFIQLTLSYLK
jgi:hypothetical protein